MSAIEASNVLTEEVLALRRAVFIDEQGVPEADELDGTDEGCTHWMLRDPAGQVASTLRVRVMGERMIIARVATRATARGHGYAGQLLDATLAWAVAEGLTEAELSAQVDVVPFYGRRGFVARGEVYEDAGIPHQTMVLDLALHGAP